MWSDDQGRELLTFEPLAGPYRSEVSRILVVNANTSAIATKRIAEICPTYVRPPTSVDFMTTAAGPEAVDTPLDIMISGLETVRVIAQNLERYDAFVIGASDDPGLDAARQITDKPVLGITEAGLLIACTLGARFSVFAALRREVPQVSEQVARYGLSSRLASILTLEEAGTSGLTSAHFIGDPEASLDRIATESSRAVRQDMAEVIVLVGSVTCGLEKTLTQRVGVPVLSGIVCALKLAEAMADLGLRTSHVYKYRTPSKSDRLVGYDDLQSFYSSKADNS